MRRRRSQGGQGLVELVALVPALVVLALIAWQVGAAGYAWLVAGGAARAGARAAEVGASPGEAVRAVLPVRYARGSVIVQPRGEAGLRVHLVVPTVAPFLPRLDVVGPDAGTAAVRRRVGGQAAVELLAAVPLLLLAGLLTWQLMAVLAAGLRAERDVRARALAASGPPGGVVVLTATAPVPAVLPGVRGLSVPARAGIRVP